MLVKISFFDLEENLLKDLNNIFLDRSIILLSVRRYDEDHQIIASSVGVHMASEPNLRSKSSWGSVDRELRQLMVTYLGSSS